MSPAFRLRLVFIKLVRMPIQSILSPGPDFIHFSPVPDFTKLVRIRILSTLSPDPDFIYSGCESRPGFYPFFSPDPNFIHRVQVRILFIFESGSGSRSGFYQACPGPCPGSYFTNTPDFSRFFFINYFTRFCA